MSRADCGWATLHFVRRRWCHGMCKAIPKAEAEARWHPTSPILHRPSRSSSVSPKFGPALQAFCYFSVTVEDPNIVPHHKNGSLHESENIRSINHSPARYRMTGTVFQENLFNFHSTHYFITFPNTAFLKADLASPGSLTS